MYNSGLYVYFESGGIKTADNGLTATGTNVQLGGALLQNTVIDIEGYTLAANMSGAGKDLQVWDGVNRINTFYQTVRFDPSDFGLNANDLIGFNATGDAYQLTASNGLTVTPASPGTNRLKLGGTLLEDTIINQSSYNYTHTLNNNIFYDILTARSVNNIGTFRIGTNLNNSLDQGREQIWFQIKSGDFATQLLRNINRQSYIWLAADGFTPVLQLGNTQTISAGSLVTLGVIQATGTVNAAIDGGSIAFSAALELNESNTWLSQYGTIYAYYGARGTWNIVNRTLGTGGFYPKYTDAYQFYSADIIGGDACPHFETEDNKTIILYPFNTYGAPTGTATRTTFDTATVTLPDLAERVKALIDDLQQNGIIG